MWIRLKRVCRPIVYFITGSACTLFVLVLGLIKPLLHVRIGWLRHERIGHLATNTELFLRRESVRESVGREWRLFICYAPSNVQLVKMIDRCVRVFIVENWFLTHAIKILQRSVQGTQFLITLPSQCNEYYEFNNIAPQLSFSGREDACGEQLLEGMGVPSDAHFFCFHSRDSAYLDRAIPDMDLRYHDFRNCDIHNYLPSVQELVDQGLYAIRMGHIVEAALPAGHDSRIIDYATKHRSDFGDIYLSAKCEFFLGNTCGLCCLPWIFNVPSAYANVPYLGYPPLLQIDVFIVMKLWSIDQKRVLTFPESMELGADCWLQSEKYKQAGIEVIENTAAEISALAQEVAQRISGTWVKTEEDEELQTCYRNLFPPDHRAYGFSARIGAEFLRQNRDLLV